MKSPLAYLLSEGLKDDSTAEVPTNEQLYDLRIALAKERRMYTLLREIFLNFVFVFILVAMSKLGRDKLAFRYQQSLKEQLNGDWHVDEDIRFDTVC